MPLSTDTPEVHSMKLRDVLIFGIPVSHFTVSNTCIYTSANPFGVKLYNTAPDTSNFTVTIHTQNLDCSDPHIHVYGDQTQTQIYVSSVSDNFLGKFRKLDQNVSQTKTYKCVYQSLPGENWPFVFIKIFSISQTENVYVCEIEIGNSS